MSFKKVDVTLTNLSSLVSKSNDEGVQSKILAEYISAFDQLFSDGKSGSNSLQTQINELLAKHTTETDLQARNLNFEYVKRIAALKQQLDLLPDNFPSKTRLTERLLDYCSPEWIEKVNKGEFTDSPENFVAFRASHETFDWNNTVEVKSWGTREELGNGLKNVLRQKIEGDDIGHVALVMRIPVNEANRKLVDKYCLKEDGCSKIPH